MAATRGDIEAAEAELNHALRELETHPVPIVAWKVHAAMGSLLARKGDEERAHEAFARAAEIVKAIAGNIADEEQRALFLNSDAIRRAMESDGESVSYWR